MRPDFALSPDMMITPMRPAVQFAKCLYVLASNASQRPAKCYIEPPNDSSRSTAKRQNENGP